MNKRIKITESQFDRLFTEDTDPVMAFQDLEEGDSIYVKDASGTHSFQVVDDLGNAVKLASLDVKSTKTGWHFIVSKLEGVRDGDIKMSQVSKKNSEVKRNYTIKGVEVIKITNKTGVEKDTIDLREPEQKQPSTNKVNRSTDNADTEEDSNQSLVDTLRQLDALQPETYYIFEVDEATNIIFKVLSNIDGEIKVKLISATGSEPEKYNKLKGQYFTIPIKLDNLTPSKMGVGWFNMGIFGKVGYMISNINDFVKYDGEDEDEDDGEDTGADERGIEDTPEFDIEQSKENISKLLDKYPELKKAIYHQPKLFGLFDIGDPVGLGRVDDLVKNYGAKQASSKFKDNKTVTLEVVNNEITLNVGAKLYRLKVGDKKQLITVKRGIKTYLTTSKAAKTRYEIEILNLVKDNIYNCKFKGISVSNDGSVRESEKNGVIKILDYGN